MKKTKRYLLAVFVSCLLLSLVVGICVNAATVVDDGISAISNPTDNQVEKET